MEWRSGVAPATAGLSARFAPPALVRFFTLASAGSSAREVSAGDARAMRAPTLAPDFEAFVHEHERVIVTFLARMLGDESEAFDLAQEVFLRAWKRFEQITGYENPRAWLLRVATNLALTALARRRGPISVMARDDGREPEASDPSWRLARRDLVWRTLERLSPQRRAALCLREIYGLSYPEVAKALGVSIPAARMALSRACEQFRAVYLREEGESYDA